MKRWIAVAALLLLLPVTLAPRTSWPIGAGWRAVVQTDTFEATTAPTSTLVFTAVPPTDWSTQTVLSVTITGGPWELVAASPGCTAGAGSVSCVLDPGSFRRDQKLRLTVRSLTGDPLNWTMSALAGS